MRVVRWIFKKLSGVLLIAALGLGGIGLWLYLTDSLSFEDRRAEIIRAFNGERNHLLQARESVAKRRLELAGKRDGEAQRIAQATRAIRALSELESSWDRVFGDGARQREYASRKEKLVAARQQSEARAIELEHLITLEDYTRDGLDLALGRLEARMEQMRYTESKLLHYLRAAWDRSKWYLFAAVGGWFLGPLLGKAALFYGVAPLIARGRPIRFAQSVAAQPEIRESRVALDVLMEPGQTLCVKERFLQASDEGLEKKTRYLFDWRMPLTSLACGLTEMIDLRNPGKGGQLHVTLSNSGDALTELASVRLHEGGSLILRPRHIAGVVMPSGGKAVIRRRWVLTRWQAWVTFQFRYFEFCGPMEIILAGVRGVRVESLAGRGVDAARRTNKNAIIGFTPDLDYRPARAETFWAYYRGLNPLFDDLLAGQGLFLCQASAVEAEETGGKFWSAVWNGAMRVFGL
ncbi:MAG: hypothetical protein WC378_02615 [Opitutaceae bacterium]|jgi:hypothetical protein